MHYLLPSLTSVFSVDCDLIGEGERDDEVSKWAWLAAGHGDAQREVLAGEGGISVVHAQLQSRNPGLDPGVQNGGMTTMYSRTPLIWTPISWTEDKW